MTSKTENPPLLHTGGFFIFNTSAMINIHDELLESLNEKELWLLIHLVKRINQDRVCWPSNKTILKDTKWKDERTLTAVKKGLIDKGILVQSMRTRADGSQTSNEYTLTTELIGVYNSGAKIQKDIAKHVPTPLHEMHPPHHKERRGQGVQTMHPHEVLNIEVLNSEESDASAQFHVQVHSLETIPTVEGEVPRPAARPTSKVSDVQANPNAFSDAAEYFLRLIEAKKYDLGTAAKYSVPYFRHKQQTGKWIALCLPSGIQEEQRWLGEHMAGVRAWADNQVKFDLQRNGTQPTPPAAPVQIRREI